MLQALRQQRVQVDAAPAAVCALDWEESAGISAPLYDIVDAVFELRSRGFFRRQVRRGLRARSAWELDGKRGGHRLIP